MSIKKVSINEHTLDDQHSNWKNFMPENKIETLTLLQKKSQLQLWTVPPSVTSSVEVWRLQEGVQQCAKLQLDLKSKKVRKYKSCWPCPVLNR